MSGLSRRSLLTAAAAIPAAVAVPAAALNAAPEPQAYTTDEFLETLRSMHPDARRLLIDIGRTYAEEEAIKKDAKLIELGRKLEEAVANANSYKNGPMKKANALYKKLCPERPEPYFSEMPRNIAKTVPEYPGFRRLTHEPRKHLTATEYAILKKYKPKHPAVVWTDESSIRDEKKHAAYRKKVEIAAEKSRLHECETEYDALLAKSWKLGERIMKQRAHSITGLQIKIRAVELLDDDHVEHGGPLETAWLSLRPDIKALAMPTGA